jgi:hypothetical protein
LGQFDKQRGLEIAYERAVKSYERENFLPPVSIIPDIEKMMERAKKYFKKEIVSTVESGINSVKEFESIQKEAKQEKKQKIREMLDKHKNHVSEYNWGK